MYSESSRFGWSLQVNTRQLYIVQASNTIFSYIKPRDRIKRISCRWSRAKRLHTGVEGGKNIILVGE
jgi:hypothetical protein